MNALLETYALLSNALLDDPLLLLASTVVWLDPLWSEAEDAFEEGDEVETALYVTRGAFPDLYAEAVERIRAGVSLPEMDRFLCAEITHRGIPLDHLEWMAYGIPLTALGVNLEDPEFYTHHLELLPIVALFGIHPEADPYNVDVPEAASTAGRMLASSMAQQDDAGLKQVGWALEWLFSCSGNSLIDLDDEALMELQPLSWEADDLAFAIELIAEADSILRDVQAGLTLLEANPVLFTTLETNIQRTYKALEKRKERTMNRKYS